MHILEFAFDVSWLQEQVKYLCTRSKMVQMLYFAWKDQKCVRKSFSCIEVEKKRLFCVGCLWEA